MSSSFSFASRSRRARCCSGLTPDGAPRFAVFEIRPLKKAARPLTLAAMRADKRFAGFELLRLPRLSVMPVPPEHDRLIRELTGLGDG